MHFYCYAVITILSFIKIHCRFRTGFTSENRKLATFFTKET